MRWRILLIVVWLWMVGGASASAATIGVKPLEVSEDEDDISGLVAVVRGGVGEANDIEVVARASGEGFELTDRGAPLRVEPGCTQIVLGRASCPVNSLVAELGMGDDRLTMAPGAPKDLSFIYGGPGDDVITGSDAPNQLTGGLGRDIIRGGAGDDAFRDDESPGAPGTADDQLDGGPGADHLEYLRRTSLTVDLSAPVPFGGEAGERDTLLGIEHVTTLFGDDVLIGDEHPNILTAGPGRNTVRGGGGPDRLSGVGVLDGGPGDDTLLAARGPVSCGSGSDVVEPSGLVRVALAADCEWILGRVPGSLLRFASPRIDPVPRRRGASLVLSPRCPLRRTDRRRCAGSLLIEDATGRRLGGAGFVLRPGAHRTIGLRVSTAALARLRPTSTVRVRLRFGPAGGQRATTNWRVPVA